MLICIFLILTVLPTSANIYHNSSLNSFKLGKTLYVGGNGLNNYSKIQDAIDNASDGDTVFVYSGIYYELIDINKSIYLIGERFDPPVIDSYCKYYRGR